MRIHEQILSSEFVEEEHRFVLKVFVLGMKKNQIDVFIDGRYLWISAKQNRTNDFQKSYLLPEHVRTESARAICQDGFLMIHFQKGIFKEHPNLIKVNVKAQSKFRASLAFVWKKLRDMTKAKFDNKSK